MTAQLMQKNIDLIRNAWATTTGAETRLWVQKSKIWTRSFIAACVLELPLLTMLLVQGSLDLHQSLIVRALVWYHVIPLSLLSWGFLSLFGHDLLKREPFPFRKETSHTEWDIAFRVLLEKYTEETATMI